VLTDFFFSRISGYSESIACSDSLKQSLESTRSRILSCQKLVGRCRAFAEHVRAANSEDILATHLDKFPHVETKSRSANFPWTGSFTAIDDDTQVVQAFFNKIDTDSNGKLSHDELQEAFCI
jgi:hypothetical protein